MSTTGSVYNTTDGPLTLDGHGHQLGGREHRDGVNLEHPRIAAHIKAGRFIGTPDEPTPTAPVPTAPKTKANAGTAAEATTTSTSED
jgi:hypothetical protein